MAAALAGALQRFAESLPRRPYCTDDPHLGQTVRGRESAMRCANLQPNTSGKVVWLAFDVDHADGAVSWNRLSAPPPTLAVENRVNGHAHLLYELQAPVPRTDAAKVRPLLYLAACQEGLRRKLQADPGYSGHLCKNPLHPRWNTRQWAGAYGLGDLAEWMELPALADMRRRVRDPDYAGLGRNCELFERLRLDAYRVVRAHWRPGGYESFSNALRIIADAYNAGFAQPLPETEIRGIAASCARWTWRHFNPTSFRQLQAARGARKGAARRAGLLPEVLRLKAEGRSQCEVAAIVGISQSTVSRWFMQSHIR